MKYIISESRIQNIVDRYLDSIEWKVWDQGDGDFGITEYNGDEDMFVLRTVKSDNIRQLVIHSKLIDDLQDVTGLETYILIPLLLNWFNKTFGTDMSFDEVWV